MRLVPPEDMIWSKAFIMERERYDGGDINHILHAQGAQLDWNYLVARFGAHWPVLLSCLILFTFAYPDAYTLVPQSVFREILARSELAAHTASLDESKPRPCRGTLLSRQYLHDVRQRGYADARLNPWGSMTPDQLARWTAAFEDT
jgi:hypothetical protein